MAKQLNARVQTKRDTEEHWNQAINFIPKDGEIIIYKKDTEPSDIQQYYDAWKEEEAKLAEIKDISSEAYTTQKTLADAAHATYDNRKTRIVPRFKVGDGEHKLADLPFSHEAFVLAEIGQTLSDYNYDKEAYDIVENIKQFKANNSDGPQYTDHQYTVSGEGLYLGENTNTNAVPIQTIYNTGLLNVAASTTNGQITFTKGNQKSKETVKINVPGLKSAAYTNVTDYATAAQGKLSDNSFQNVGDRFVLPSEDELTVQKLFDLGYLKENEIPDSASWLKNDGKTTKLSSITSTTQPAVWAYLETLQLNGYNNAKQTLLKGKISLKRKDNVDIYATVKGLGKMAYVNDISNLTNMIGVSQSEDGTYTAGKSGLVPAPSSQDYNKVLFSDGLWHSIGDIKISTGGEESGLFSKEDKIYNGGILSIGLSETLANTLTYTQYQYTTINDKTDYYLVATDLPLGADVQWESTLTSGQKIGTLTINSVENILYAPVASDRVAKAGDVMTGDLTVKKSRPQIMASDENGATQISLLVSAGDEETHRRGVYDNTSSRWLITCDSSNNAYSNMNFSALSLIAKKDSYPQLLLSNTAGNPRGMIFVNTGSGAVGDLYLRAYSSDTAYSQAYLTTAGVFSAPSVEGAVFNDYAEYRALKAPIESYEPGYCMTCNRDGKLFRTSSRMQHCEGITSDTFGFSIGRTNEATVPIAVAGRVLVYPLEEPDTYYTGQAVCASRDGKVSKMTDVEVRQNPDRIVGIVSEIPTYKTWGTNNVEVNGRIWITIK